MIFFLGGGALEEGSGFRDIFGGFRRGVLGFSRDMIP